MKRLCKNLTAAVVTAILAVPLFTGCGDSSKPSTPLTAGDVDCGEVSGLDENCDPVTQEPGKSGIFEGTTLGVPISTKSMGAIDPDPTGYMVTNDYDGDGIPNDQEVTTSPYVADYPKIVARVTTPVTMEIRIDETSISENHSETVEEDGTKQTISNSMEDRQYSMINDKTTPYVSKEQQQDVYGYNNEDELSINTNMKGSFGVVGIDATMDVNTKTVRAENFDKSTMTEKTVFEDVHYIDNMDSSGVTFTDDTVKTITSNARRSETLKNTETIGPNNGLVRASFFLKNKSVNIPAHVSNVVCTLTFRTSSGSFLPIKTFKLRNEDYTEFSQDIYGGEELGPFVIELSDLNTHEVRNALLNGYIPQINVVSYDLDRVQDSNYNPGVDNLKIVEETAKGRTAYISISAQDMRQDYRVCAFDVDGDGNFVPGISLKKALFNILHDRIGDGEQWTEDNDGNLLTVPDANLKWVSGAPDKTAHTFVEERMENNWRRFSTYIKTYNDEYNTEHKIETIKRIDLVQKYNPFNTIDNPSYDPGELLSDSEISKMKYWIILHNGQYFEGDINDPIWAGDRYEIICFDVEDYNDYQKTYMFSPLQSQEKVYTSTYWNSLNNSAEFDRAIYLGQVYKGEVVHLEIDLLQSRRLLPDSTSEVWSSPANSYENSLFNNAYQFEPESTVAEGIPTDFTHTIEGGTNNIVVSIDESEQVSNYEINVTSDSKDITVNIPSGEVSKRNGIIVLTRRTKLNWTSGDEIGILDGDEYNVTVKAENTLHGVAVYKNSQANGNTTTTVYDVGSTEYPGSFTYKVTENTNSIDIAISQCANTEYYVVKLTGPKNYTYDPEGVTYICHAGYNTIDLPNPSGEVTDSGVYEITVYPVNNNYVVDNIDQLNTTYNIYSQFVEVPFERFESQKLYKAALESDLKKFDDIDLEVNFNDGSGWYRLQLDSNSGLQLANSEGLNRVIDCRFNSYYEYDKQKFHIYFMAPNGYSGDDVLSSSQWDVFGGGREETSVYIRTVAEKEYRDRFWMKDQVLFNNGSLVSTITNSSTDLLPFVTFWLNQDGSDVTYLEKYSNGDAAPDGFALTSTDMDSYFFSPLDYKVYSIKATIADDVQTNSSMVDLPSYTAASVNKGIIINNVSSIYLDSYKIFWRVVPNDLNVSEAINFIKNENIFTHYEWNSTRVLKGEEILADSDSNGEPDGYLIDGLTPNQNYVIAVVGYNKNGVISKARYYGSDDDSSDLLDNLQLVTPYTTDQAPAPQGIYVTAVTDGGIAVSNIYVEGYTDFEIQWMLEGQDWQSVDYHTDSFDPFAYTIQSTNSWNNTYVRVRAYSIDPDENRIDGFWSQVYIVPSTASTSLSKPTISWRHTGDYKARITLNLSEYDVPDGAVDVKVDGVLYRDQYYYKYYQYTKYDETTTEYTDTINCAWTTIGANTQIDLTGDLTTETISGAGTTYVTFYYLNAVYTFTISFRNSNGEVITSGGYTTNLGDAPTI